MRAIFYVLISVFALAAVAAGAAFISFGNDRPAPIPGGLEECVTIKENSKDGINIVFFAEDKEDAEKYAGYFSKSSPFDSHKNEFNFYYIGDYKPACELYNNIAILCYSNELVQKSGSCPNDQIVVLNGDYGTSIRSSNYLNVMSINIKHPMSVLLHEFGHSFVNLAEEYVPAKIPRNSGGNCVEDCADFGGKNDGCYTECSRTDYSRSVENGVMRTLSSEEYGRFNEFVITSRIDELTGESAENAKISGNAVDENSDCSGKSYYLIEGSYIEKLDAGKKEVVQGCFGDSGYGGFLFDLILADDSRINIGKFSPEFIFTDGVGESLPEEVLGSPSMDIDGETFISDKNFYLKVPIVENAKRVEIIEPGLRVVVSTPICKGALIGDVNGDQTIDIFDVYDLDDGLETGYFNCKDNGDFNQDGIINIRDRDELYASLSGEQISRGGSIASVDLN